MAEDSNNRKMDGRPDNNNSNNNNSSNKDMSHKHQQEQGLNNRSGATATGSPTATSTSTEGAEASASSTDPSASMPTAFTSTAKDAPASTATVDAPTTVNDASATATSTVKDASATAMQPTSTRNSASATGNSATAKSSTSNSAITTSRDMHKVSEESERVQMDLNETRRLLANSRKKVEHLQEKLNMALKYIPDHPDVKTFRDDIDKAKKELESNQQILNGLISKKNSIRMECDVVKKEKNLEAVPGLPVENVYNRAANPIIIDSDSDKEVDIEPLNTGFVRVASHSKTGSDVINVDAEDEDKSTQANREQNATTMPPTTTTTTEEGEEAAVSPAPAPAPSIQSNQHIMKLRSNPASIDRAFVNKRPPRPTATSASATASVARKKQNSTDHSSESSEPDKKKQVSSKRRKRSGLLGNQGNKRNKRKALQDKRDIKQDSADPNYKHEEDDSSDDSSSNDHKNENRKGTKNNAVGGEDDDTTFPRARVRAIVEQIFCDDDEAEEDVKIGPFTCGPKESWYFHFVRWRTGQHIFKTKGDTMTGIKELMREFRAVWSHSKGLPVTLPQNTKAGFPPNSFTVQRGGFESVKDLLDFSVFQARIRANTFLRNMEVTKEQGGSAGRPFITYINRLADFQVHVNTLKKCMSTMATNSNSKSDSKSNNSKSNNDSNDTEFI